MLVFCEECGSRNMLNDTDAHQPKIRFRCVSCDYENVWRQPQQEARNALQERAVVVENSPLGSGDGKGPIK